MLGSSPQTSRPNLGSDVLPTSPATSQYCVAFKPCVLIPCFDHHRELAEIVAKLRLLQLTILIVDDGSHELTRNVLAQLGTQIPELHILRHDHNRGKGAAIKTGIAWARTHGYSHCVQIDSDGQHEINDVMRLLEVARNNSSSLICGAPVFDSSAPLIRRWGRLLSVGLVWFETRSTQLRDPLCGFRVYPVSETCNVVERTALGDRMGFDPEIAVYMQWFGVGVVSVPTKVVYPPENTSHFRYVRDNIGMFILHCRLLVKSLLPKDSLTRSEGV